MFERREGSWREEAVTRGCEGDKVFVSFAAVLRQRSRRNKMIVMVK